MTRERQSQVLIALLLVAIGTTFLLPPLPGALVGGAALLGALFVFVRARALRTWLFVALLAAALLAVGIGAFRVA